ncbi:hypothetical protein K439DRAFT_1637307, partial [Ramaria rubella]
TQTNAFNNTACSVLIARDEVAQALHTRACPQTVETPNASKPTRISNAFYYLTSSDTPSIHPLAVPSPSRS